MRIHWLVILVVICFACKPDKRGEVEKKPDLFLPEDLEATLWAESPLFYNPTNIDVDARGRIWVTEAVNYRNYNNDSTKVLHHEKGDRVVILEDTNGDGKADDSKVFVQDRDLVSPLGIAVIGNKVFVSCSPHLIVYTDTDGDDKPDSKEILLTGFGGKDHDHSLHAVIGGPDGKLYFITGNAGPHIVKDKSGWTLRSGSIYTGGSPFNLKNQGNMKSDDGNVWVGGLALRMDMQGRGLKVLAHNFRNAYELAIDSRGDLWQNDNDDQVVACRTSWLMEGGNAGYFSTDGTRTWQADQRPWQDVFTAHWHQDDPGVMPAGDKTGAGAPTGIVVNEGDALGKKYRGLLLSADAGRNVIFGYHPQRLNSGYDLGARTNFITSLQEDNPGYVWNDSSDHKAKDKWFRPSDVAIGTDGAIYVADWYDPIVGGHQMQDATGYGRIYRITPKGKSLIQPSIDIGAVKGQLAALKSPAINVRYTAFEKLKSQGPSIIDKVRPLLQDENPYHQARAIWLLSYLGAEGRAEVERMLSYQEEDIRLVAFRALRQTTSEILPYAEKLAADPSPFVRREVIIALHDLPFQKAKPVLLSMLDRYDGHDRWYLEALGFALSGHESEIFPELIKRLNPKGLGPEEWDEKLVSLAWRLHPVSAVDDLKARAGASSLPEAERSRALTTLAFIHSRSAAEAMITLSKSENKEVAEQATYWLTFRQSNDWYSLLDWSKTGINAALEQKVNAMKVKRGRILDALMPLDEKKWNAQDMAKDPIGGQMLLGLVAEKKLPEPLVPVVEALLIENPDRSVRIQASLYFKKPGSDISFSIPSIMKMNKDALTGKSIFSTSCATCHRVHGAGMEVGPELSLIRTKFDREGLLDAIINPSAGIVFGYESWTIALNDGQSFFGFLVAEGDQTVIIKDLTGAKHTIPKDRISSRKKLDKSLMPEPFALGLSEQDLAHVSEYLMTLK